MAGGADRTETQSPAQLAVRGAKADALFVVLQCRRPTEAPLRLRIDLGATITLGRGPELAVTAEGRDVRIALADPLMSSTHARIEGTPGAVKLVDAGSKNGTRVNGAPRESVVLEDGDWIEVGTTLLRFRRQIVEMTGPVVHQVAMADPLATLVPELAARFERLAQIARANLPVLVTGETGTGKELVARALHRLAARAGAFVPVNCGAIPGTLVESELFGHRKGAFSGAGEDRAGLVRSADRGTLFLDEIGELPLPAQAALLRVLQEREVQPVGADRAIPVDLAVVSATHRSLAEAIAARTFREDLFARLAGHVIALPALRERAEDLGVLIGRILARRSAAQATIELEAARVLVAHEWPRNVRELELVLAGALAADPACVRVAQLDALAPARGPELRDDDADRRQQIEALLREHHGNVSHVAKAMGKARSLVQKWIARYGIDAERYRS
jgi:transcriptional regulator with PAS, ATPase and Fis domain